MSMTEVFGVSVRDFGATGDGRSDDAPAIQAALDAGEARVVVPAGHYALGAGLKIGSDTHLLAHPNALFRMMDGVGQSQHDFLITNADFDGGNRNIRVEGGVWDGNNPGNPRGPDAPDSYSGVMINFTNVQGLTLRALRLVDAESYFVRFGKVSDFLVENIAFEINTLRPNQDGVHISGFCSDGIIRDLRGLGSFTPNDDMAALLADDALHRAQNLNGAFNGPIERVRVERLRAHSCHSFVRLLSVNNPISDIEINDVEGGCTHHAINMDACRECRVKLFVDGDFPDGVGSITNIRAADFNVHKLGDAADHPMIDFRTHVDNFRIERFRRNPDLDSCPGSPTLHIAKAGPLEVVVEGVEDGAIDAEVGALQSPTGPARRARRTLTSADSLTLTSGGFTSLEARKV